MLLFQQFNRSTLNFLTILDCIHKTLLYPAEEHNSHEEHQQCYPHTHTHLQGVNSAGAEKDVTKCLYDGGNGVQADYPLPLVRYAGDRVNDRSRVHPELDPKTDQVGQVPVLRRQGRHDNPESESENGHLKEKQREKQNERGHPDGSSRSNIIANKTEEQGKLDSKGYQAADHIRYRHGETGEIDLAENARVADEGG